MDTMKSIKTSRDIPPSTCATLKFAEKGAEMLILLLKSEVGGSMFLQRCSIQRQRLRRITWQENRRCRT